MGKKTSPSSGKASPAETRKEKTEVIVQYSPGKQRSVSLQTIHNSRTYTPVHVATKMQNEYQDYKPFFAKPHTMATLGLLLGTLWIFANYSPFAIEESDEDQTIEIPGPATLRAVKGVAIGFIGFGAIHLPNTMMTRPISFVWRLLLSVFVLYVMFMTFVLMLPANKARGLFKVFDSELGVPLPERNYAEDCRVFTPDHPTSPVANISDAVFDVHFVAHFLGWWGKMLFMRDWYVAWICSGMFEVCELTFRHWLPNFYECWWDHLFLDLFGCNLIGIILGHFTIKYYGIDKINWIRDESQTNKENSDSDQPQPCNARILSAFKTMKPTVFEKYEWTGLSCLTNFFGVSLYVLVLLTVDCNNFFLKYALWVPAEHDILKYRVALWGLCAIPTSKEWYEFTVNEHCHRLGPFAWLTFMGAAVEVMIVLKISAHEFTEPFPIYVKIMWSIISSIYVFLMVSAYQNGLMAEKEKAEQTPGAKPYNPYNPEVSIVNH